jgi:cellulose biosynthesis protein BcsQ
MVEPTISIFTQAAILASDTYLVPIKPDPLSVLGLPLLERWLEDCTDDSGRPLRSNPRKARDSTYVSDRLATPISPDILTFRYCSASGTFRYRNQGAEAYGGYGWSAISG